jgi:hypothetical protein
MDRTRLTPRRIILSRKGFDAGAGGYPSPIFPASHGRRFVSLPIPDRDLSCSYSSRFAIDGISYFELMKMLRIRSIIRSGRRSPLRRNTPAHFDPDLRPHTRSTAVDWRPSLGQVGAAQSHLAARVDVGDLFLFFGWFRHTEFNHENRLKYVGDDFHAIWGWLYIGEIRSIKAPSDAPSWASDHPHVRNAAYQTKANNTLYIASDQGGAGAFESFETRLRLTAPGRTRSIWQLPRAFQDSDITHVRRDAWSPASDPAHVIVRSGGRGQEFVVTAQPALLEWAESLIDEGRRRHRTGA